MKDARLINCVFLFPCKNSLQLNISKYSDRIRVIVLLSLNYYVIDFFNAKDICV